MESNAAVERVEKIDQYLRNELPEADRTAFEHQLQADESLAEEVERVQFIRSIVRNYGYRQNLRAIHEKAMTDRQQDNFWSQARFPVGIAAAVALFLVCALVIRLSTLSGNALLKQGYQAYEAEVTRGEAPVTDNVPQLMVHEYAIGNYAAVVQLYKGHRITTPYATFIAANAYLALSKPAQAIPLFQNILSAESQSDDQNYYQDAEYYLAWAYLKNNQLPEADALFTRIYRNPYHPYHSQLDWWLYWQIKLLRLKQGV